MARAWVAGLPWAVKAATVVAGVACAREVVARATEKSLKGEVAVVTGGGSGIGRLLCLLFAAEGARVAVWDINGAAADAVVTEIRAAGGDARSYVGDVSDRNAVYALAGDPRTRSPPQPIPRTSKPLNRVLPWLRMSLARLCAL